MKKARFTTEQIIEILQEHAAEAEPADLIRRHGISRATPYHWKKQYGDLQVSDAERPQGPRRRESPAQAAGGRSRAESAGLEGRPGKRALTTATRRAVVSTMEGRDGLSERRACRFLGVERTALRYVPRRPERDAPLRAQLRGVADRRRARKRLAVPRVPRPVVTAPNDTRGIDVVSDQLSSGRRFRVFTVIDHCTKASPGMAASHSLPSTAVIDALEAMIAERGQPARRSLDHGSEFRSRAFDAWAADRGIERCFIQPGKPIQHCFIESFSTARPHESCLPLTPTEFAETFGSTARLSA